MADSIVVGILRALLTADTAEFDSAMKRASGQADDFAKDLGKIGKQATNLGTQLTKTLTVPIAGMAAASAKAFIDFESSFAGVGKTVDGVSDQFGNLTDFGKNMAGQFRDLAKQIPINVNDLNRLGEAAGALGIPKQEITKFVEVMAKLGVTTNLTADQAADAIARIQNIFGAAGKDTDRLASTLVALGNAGASTEKEIVEMAQRIAGAGHTIGLTQDQVLSFASSLASVGINAEAGGSAISRIFLKMNDAVMSGGDALKEWARVAGMKVSEFKTLFEKDAAQATVAFISGLGRLKSEGENTNHTMEGLIGKNIILKDTLNRLTGAGQLLSDQLAIGNKAWKENTALNDEAAKRFATTESQLKLLWARITDVGITIGNALKPAIDFLIGAMNNLIPILDSASKMFGAMPGSVQLVVLGIGALAAGVGPLIYLFGQLAIAASAVAAAFGAQGIATRALTAYNGLLASSLSMVGKAAAGVGVAFAGWEVGRWLGDTFNLSDGYERIFGRLMGLTRAEIEAGMAARKQHEAMKGQATQTDETAKVTAALTKAIDEVDKATTALTTKTKASGEETKKVTKLEKERTQQLELLTQARKAEAALHSWDVVAREVEAQRAYAAILPKVKQGLDGIRTSLLARNQATLGLNPAIVEQVELDQSLALALANVAEMNAEANKEAAKTPAALGSVRQAVKGTLEELGNAISGTFSQMLLGAKGFHDGFVDVWNSIKASVSRILTQIIDDFSGRFIKGLINVITGSEAGFSGAFTGVFTKSIQASSGPAAASATDTGGIAGSAWASGFMKIAGPAIEAWVLWKAATSLLSWIGGGQGTGTPNPPEYDRSNPNPGDTNPADSPDGDMGKSGGDNGQPPTTFGVGGVIRPRAGGLLARLAEQGYPETVLPGDWSGLLNAPPMFAGLGSSMRGVEDAGHTAVFVLEKDGKREAQWILPFLAGETQRLRLA